MLKKIVITLYVLVVVLLAAITVIENIYDTTFVNQHFYGSWWFCLLWAVFTAAGILYIVQRRMRKWSLLLLHLSFVVILLGAWLTHATSFKGTVHLRGDQPTNQYSVMTSMTETESHDLPFYVRLSRFQVVNTAGTLAPTDYVTNFVIIDGAKNQPAQVSMNKVYTYRGVRFYQASYDTDARGSYLSVNSDPWGLPITYLGYALLFFSLIWLLLDPKATFRRLLKNPLLRKGALMLALVVSSSMLPTASQAATTVDRTTADKFGRLFINYNNRICPVQTFACDYVKKLYGKRTYEGLTPEQVLTSWIFFPREWRNEPIIRVKSSELREHFGLSDYESVHSFFRDGNYILGPYAHEYAEGQTDALHKACAEMDAKLQVCMYLQEGSVLTIFPHTVGANTIWYSPADSLPSSLGQMNILFFRNAFPLLYDQIASGNVSGANHVLDKILAFQQQNAGKSLPTPTQVEAERIYNVVPFATILAMANLALGFLALFLTIRRLMRKDDKAVSRKADYALLTLLGVSFLGLTFCLALRWIVSGNVPLSNGYESMLSVAWFVELLSLLAYRKARIVLVFGFLLSGFFLLVSHINQMDPAIGPMMPVLNSPLLSVHVSIIMMSYALLSLTFICALTAVIIHFLTRNAVSKAERDLRAERLEALQVLSRLFLYPSITTMGLGIFIGAIWANISWGAYWSWDPKETWALITFMIYAVVLHTQSLPAFRRPMVYHLYMLVAFLSIVMTYFGVNYVLGGMHSYA